MTPSQLRTLGDRHGYGWQTRLSRCLGVNSRSVRRWLSGKVAINNGMAGKIRRVFGEWEGRV